jgi:hypothetical protein
MQHPFSCAYIFNWFARFFNLNDTASGLFTVVTSVAGFLEGNFSSDLFLPKMPQDVNRAINPAREKMKWVFIGDSFIPS